MISDFILTYYEDGNKKPHPVISNYPCDLFAIITLNIIITNPKISIDVKFVCNQHADVRLAINGSTHAARLALTEPSSATPL